MEPSAPPADPAAPPRRPRWRLLGAGAAVLLVAAAAWGVHAKRAAERAPEGLFAWVRDRVVAGDGGALWRVMLPRARADYERFCREAAGRTDPATEEWRRRAGITRDDLRTLPPEAIMARENAAFAPEFFEGARVYRVDRWDEETALLRISTKAGLDRQWLVRRVDGSWRMDDFQPLVTQDGTVIPRSGEKARPGLVPVDGAPAAPPLGGPGKK